MFSYFLLYCRVLKPFRGSELIFSLRELMGQKLWNTSRYILLSRQQLPNGFAINSALAFWQSSTHILRLRTRSREAKVRLRHFLWRTDLLKTLTSSQDKRLTSWIVSAPCFWRLFPKRYFLVFPHLNFADLFPNHPEINGERTVGATHGVPSKLSTAKDCAQHLYKLILVSS